MNDTNTQPKERINIQEHIIVIPLVTEYYWIRTEGMYKFNLPELEIVGIPRFMYSFAGMILNNVADYMINGDGEIKAGEKMAIGHMIAPFLFEESPQTDTDPDWYEGRTVLRLVDAGDPIPCSKCASGDGTPHIH